MLLRLVPGSIALFDVELGRDPLANLAAALDVDRIVEWPPRKSEYDLDAISFFRANLAAGADPSWGAHYVIRDRVLVANAGFFGPPENSVLVDVGGTEMTVTEVEIGYSVCELYRRQGIAAAVVGLLVSLANARGVHSVRARTKPDNVGSLRTLTANRFEQVGVDGDGLVVFRRPTQQT